MSQLSPPRRIPLPLSNLPDSDDPVAQEIDSHCKSEIRNYAILGTLTPRRDQSNASGATPRADRDSPRRLEEEYDPYKHAAFQPKRPPPHDESAAVKAIPPPPQQPKKEFYFQLQRLFEALNDTEPSQHKALYALSIVCGERNPMIRWSTESKLDRSIKERQTAYDKVVDEKRLRAKQLLDEQKQPPSERELLHRRLENSRIDSVLATESEAHHLREFERQVQLENEKLQREEEIKKKRGEELKAQAKEAAERRRLEREKKLQELLDKDEETRDELDAVLRVRMRLEEEKKKSMNEAQTTISNQPQASSPSS